MSQYGFVYVLWNKYMPDIYKVGCTERSPHARAEELSKATGVPAPFEVVCYAEVPNFQDVERRLHRWLGDERVSESREFFESSLEDIVRWLYWLPERLSFGRRKLTPEKADQEERYCEGLPLVCVDDLDDLENPWAPATPKLVVPASLDGAVACHQAAESQGGFD